MPDLGTTPKVRAYGPEASYFFTQISLAFDQALRANLPPGVHYFDTLAVFSHAYANLSEYGFTNATDLFLSAPPGTDPDTYVFFDDAHPTTAVHALLADALYESVAPPVIINGCDSGVPNSLLSSGSTVSDLIAQAAMSAKNHGQFVSAVASITNDLRNSKAISGSQTGAIQRCAANAN